MYQDKHTQNDKKRDVETLHTIISQSPEKKIVRDNNPLEETSNELDKQNETNVQ